MRRMTIGLGLCAALALGATAPASGVTNGTPDGENHPYVGLIIFDDANGPAWRCTGALISPTVVLTAGHCTEGAVAARVWFKADVTKDTTPAYPFAGDGSVEGVPHTSPRYNVDNPYGGGQGLPSFSYRDIGLVELEAPVTDKGYAELPEAGFNDSLKSGTPVDFVGYGVQEQVMSVPGENPYDRWTGVRVRTYAPGATVSGKFLTSPDYLKLTLNPGKGRGGTCFGDSGGPDLLGGTNTVLSVNSYVTNSNCSGVGYGTRVDIPEELAWIQSFIDE